MAFIKETRSLFTSHRGGRLKWIGRGLTPEVMEGILDRYNTGLATFVPKVPDWVTKDLGDEIISASDEDIDRLVPVILSRDPALDQILDAKHQRSQIRHIVFIISRLSYSNNHIGKQLIEAFNVTPFELLMNGWHWFQYPETPRGISQDQILDAIDKICQPGAESSANRVKAISRIILDRGRNCSMKYQFEVLKEAIYSMTPEECASFEESFRASFSGDLDIFSFLRMRKLDVPVAAFSWCQNSYLSGDVVECRRVIASVKKHVSKAGIPYGVVDLVMMFVV